MNSKRVKGKGKRLIAGFLAGLMLVALLPANTRSVAYAEELVAAEADVSDNNVVKDEETEAVDINAVIDENMLQVNEEEEAAEAESMETAPIPTGAAEQSTAVGFKEDGRPTLLISGEEDISLDYPRPGNILALNYTLDNEGKDTSTIKWYKIGSDGKSELIATEAAVDPIGVCICNCGLIMKVYTYGLSPEESKTWGDHGAKHLEIGELSNFTSISWEKYLKYAKYSDTLPDEIYVPGANKTLTITDDLIGCTIYAEVIPDIEDENYAEGEPVETEPTGVVVGADFVPLCNLELIAGDIPGGTYDHTITKTGFTIKADVDSGSGEDEVSKNVTVDTSNKTIDGHTYTARLKMGGVGTKDYRSIQFTTGDAEAILEIVCASADDENPSSLGIGTITKDDTDGTETLTEFTGKYILHEGAEKDYQNGGIKIDNNSGIGDTRAETVRTVLAANTTYCLYTEDGSGINFYAIYATYENGLSANYYTVTFDANGGDAVASQRALKGELYLEPSATRTGYTLSGWYLSKAHADIVSSDDYKYHFTRAKVNRNLTLYAGWVKDDTGTGGEGDVLEFTKEPALSIARGTSSVESLSLTAPYEGNVLTVDYTLALAEGAADASTITWYRTREGEADTTIKTGTAADDGIQSYIVAGGDKGYRIKVEVTPKDSADNAGSAKSAETGTVKAAGEETGDKLTFTMAPELSSSGSVDAPKPGDVLEVRYGLAVGEGETDNSTILWYSGGTKIPVLEGSMNYTVTAADIGKVITVKVTPYISETKYGDTVTLKTGTVTNVQQGGGADTPSDETGLRIVFNDGDVYTYTGSAIKPSITVWNNNDRLVEGTDYTVKYSNNIKASETKNDQGTLVPIYDSEKKRPAVTVTGKGNLGGKTSATFKIYPKNLNDAQDDATAVNAGDLAELKLNDVVVLPNKKAAPVLLYGGMKLTAKDYTVKAVTGSKDDTITKPANATWAEDAANATITLEAKAKGNYTGEVTIKVIVVDAARKNAAGIKAVFTEGNSAKTQYYTAESITPKITVMNSDSENPKSSDATDKDKKLEKDVDYVISYSADTTNVGTKKVTVTGISANCIGTVTLSYSIKPAKNTNAELVAILNPKDPANADGYDFVSTGVTLGDDLEVCYKYKYEGEDEFEIVDTTLTEGVDYKVTYSNNKKAGENTAAYVVTGLGNYKGLKTAKQYFTIKGLVLSNEKKSEIAGEGIQLIVGDKVYNNKKAVYKSVPSLIVNGELVKPSEYTVYYRLDENADWKTKPDAIELGEDEKSKTVYVKVEPKRSKVNYIAAEDGKELTASYDVVKETKKDLSRAKITILDEDGNAAKVAYTGNEVKPYKAVIKISGLSNTEIILDGDNADYEENGFKVTYANNKLKGKATIVIEAIEDNIQYVGSKIVKFSIVQKNFSTASFIKSLFK